MIKRNNLKIFKLLPYLLIIGIALIANLFTNHYWLAGETNPVLPEPQLLWPSGPQNNLIIHKEPQTYESKEVGPYSLSKSNRVYSKVSVPSYVIHLPPPEKNTGVSVVICPGGSFLVNCFDREGNDLALLLAQHGITSLVLNYRLNAKIGKEWAIPMDQYIPAAVQDAQEAIRTLRRQAGKLDINPNKIGIVGFSAGGFLAAWLALQEEGTVSQNEVSWKPNFAGLFYAVLPAIYDIRKNVCPPIFIMNAWDDKATPSSECLNFYSALLKAEVSAEMHLFAQGSHGFSLDYRKGNSLALWSKSFVAWLKDIHNLKE